MTNDLKPGSLIRIDGKPAEVITQNEVGDITYLRVHIQDRGIVSVDTQNVEIERVETGKWTDALENGHSSADHFDVRTQAEQLRLAHSKGQLLSLKNSLVRLEPYQLACVNKVMQQLRQRALIADDVGLGKTIEAGLILKELDARDQADRILFVVPAHLQNKWIKEMKQFFGIRLIQADRTWVKGEKRRLGEDTNIWKQSSLRIITSMAFLRRSEFTDVLDDAFWDVAVIDEAHKASKKRSKSTSLTTKRIDQISSNSNSLLLLSATPHNGKEISFRSLIEFVDPLRVAKEQELTRDSIDDLMVRRGKDTILDDEGYRVFPKREVKTVEVSMTEREKEFDDQVRTYVREIYNRSDILNKPVVGFAMARMQKRLVSSLGAIRSTLKKRLSKLCNLEEVELSQEAKDLYDGQDLKAKDLEKAESDLEKVTVSTDEALKEELDTLKNLVNQADAISEDSKAAKVRAFIEQLLEEHPEEKILLFTEFTDTLEYILDQCKGEPWFDEIMVIDGSVKKDKRSEIEDEFNYGTQRLLFATDAASEGIDLQKSCHIMVNYELPWDPNTLEQRIGRIHRYGQEHEVKVWNFQFEDSLESKVFKKLEMKIENIREHVGETADVLGAIENIDVQQFIMNCISEGVPVQVAGEQFEEEMEKRERELEEWVGDSLIDPSTFDAESRRKINELMDASEDVFGSEGDVQKFVLTALEAIGGDYRRKGDTLFTIDLPSKDDLFSKSMREEIERATVTFSRETATRADQAENLVYLSPDHSLVKALVTYVVGDGFGGSVGVKMLAQINEPGITFNYRITFEDGAGEVLQEELYPVHVPLTADDANHDMGVRITESSSLDGNPEEGAIQLLKDSHGTLQARAESYLSREIRSITTKLRNERSEKVEKEKAKLDTYATSERRRLDTFIQDYEEKQETGKDMQIAITKQRKRIEALTDRVKDQKEAVEAKGRVRSLEPELVNCCYAIPA